MFGFLLNLESRASSECWPASLMGDPSAVFKCAVTRGNSQKNVKENEDVTWSSPSTAILNTTIPGILVPSPPTTQRLRAKLVTFAHSRCIPNSWPFDVMFSKHLLATPNSKKPQQCIAAFSINASHEYQLCRKCNAFFRCFLTYLLKLYVVARPARDHKKRAAFSVTNESHFGLCKAIIATTGFCRSRKINW